MFEVNIVTESFIRKSIPSRLVGLVLDDLRNLQTVLNPVPDELKDLEYWPGNETLPTLLDTEKLGDEIAAFDGPNKQINVTYEVINKTSEEIAGDVERLGELAFRADRPAAMPDGYDRFDVEVLEILRAEVFNLDESIKATTPLCAIVAGVLGVTETAVRNSVRSKGNSYYIDMVTVWANRRLAKGGA